MGGKDDTERPSHGRWKWSKAATGCALMVAGIVPAALLVCICAKRELTYLESGLLQLWALAFSILGSWVLGSSRSEDQARAAFQRQCRPAFRRLQDLLRALLRTHQLAASQRERVCALADGQDRVPLLEFDSSLRMIEVLLEVQLETTDSAMKDWEDLAPDEVAEMRRRRMEAEPSDGEEPY